MNLYETIGNLLAAFVVGMLAYLVPKVKSWLEAKTNKDTADWLMQLVTSFCRAAEQLYKAQDPDGTMRNQYVRTNLQALGIEITESVINMIESAVWEINTETKKAQIQDKALAAGDDQDE